MNKTSIEWVRQYHPDGTFTEGHTVNPIHFRPHGSDRTTTMCQKVSPGCKNCYAESITQRFWPKSGLVRIDELGQKWPNEDFPGYTALGVSAEVGEFILDEKQLQSVLKHRKPTRIFWGDMTDNFQAGVPDAFLDRCFAVCALTPHITHMFLTKRPERMWEYFQGGKAFETRSAFIGAEAVRLQEQRGGDPIFDWSGLPLPNVWLGTSVESQAAADERIPWLLQTPAAVRFLSCEPLLEMLDLTNINQMVWFFKYQQKVNPSAALRNFNDDNYPKHCRLDALRGISAHSVEYQEKVDWVIVGGESGQGSRRFHVDWMRSLIGHCAAAGVACFAKQLGSLPVEWSHAPGFTEKIVKLNSSKGGDWDEWPADLRVRQFPEVRP